MAEFLCTPDRPLMQVVMILEVRNSLPDINKLISKGLRIKPTHTKFKMEIENHKQTNPVDGKKRHLTQIGQAGPIGGGYT